MSNVSPAGQLRHDSEIEHEHDPNTKKKNMDPLEEYKAVRESQDDEALGKRARMAWNTIAERSEHEHSFAVVSHSAFFYNMFAKGQSCDL